LFSHFSQKKSKINLLDTFSHKSYTESYVENRTCRQPLNAQPNLFTALEIAQTPLMGNFRWTSIFPFSPSLSLLILSLSPSSYSLLLALFLFSPSRPLSFSSCAKYYRST
jgi:hypothetical protein